MLLSTQISNVLSVRNTVDTAYVQVLFRYVVVVLEDSALVYFFPTDTLGDLLRRVGRAATAPGGLQVAIRHRLEVVGVRVAGGLVRGSVVVAFVQNKSGEVDVFVVHEVFCAPVAAALLVEVVRFRRCRSALRRRRVAQGV